MKGYLPITGYDQSLRNWGWAKAKYWYESGELEVVDIGVILTKKEVKKQPNCLVSSDDIRAATILAKGALDAIESSAICFAEVPTGSQSSRAGLGNGIGYGIIGMLKALDYNIIEILPNEVKMATVGKTTGTKKEIISRAVEKWPHLEWPRKTVKEVVSLTDKKAEHMADAIGAIEAGICGEEFQKILAVHKSLITKQEN